MLPFPGNPQPRNGDTPSVLSMSTQTPAFEPPPGSYPETPGPPSSAPRSLAQAVHARRAEYTKPRTVRIKIGSWNVASKSGTEQDVGGWFIGGKGVAEALTGLQVQDPSEPHYEPVSGDKDLEAREGVAEQEERRTKRQSTLPLNDPGEVPGGEDVGIYVLGLQEIVDVTSPTEALRPYADPTQSNKYKTALDEALPPGYRLIAEQQLVGLLMLVYAAPDVAPLISNVSTTSVGTGLMGYMGNKGAVTVRFVLGDTTRLVFINAHMGAGLGKAELERRNWDANQIITRTKFEPVTDSFGITQDHGERIGDEDFSFWFGDLNYRLEGIPGEDVRRLLMLHTRNEYDIGSRAEAKIEAEIERAEEEKRRSEAKTDDNSSSSPTIRTSSSLTEVERSGNGGSTFDQNHPETLEDDALEATADPASLQTTIESLLPHDELRQQQKQKRVFHDGWREGPITFLPTYKYDVGSVGIFDTGEKRRAPSWTDRILFRTRKDVEAYEDRLKEEEEARKRDDVMKAHGMDSATEDEDSMLFDYDPEADGEEIEDDAPTNTGEPPERVVTKEGYEDIIALEYYLSHQRVLSSDHKPLNAIFSLKYDAVIPDAKSRIHQEIARDMDRAENEGRPVITIVVDGETDDHSSSFNGIDFGEIRYKEPKHHSATIANTGSSEAQFGFALGPESDDHPRTSMPEWIKAQVELESDKQISSKSSEEWEADVPKSFTLKPGETCNVHLTAEITNKSLIRRLNKHQPLEDTLVLRVKDGRDHFLPVHGVWQKSSHGNAIDKLIRIPEGGIRKLQRQKPKDVHDSSSDTEDDTVVSSAPREIFRLTDAIESLTERIIAEWGMRFDFASEERMEPPWSTFAGWPFVEESWALKDLDRRSAMLFDIREALDTDQSFDKTLPTDITPLQKVEVLAEALLQFLDDLEDGVITPEMWTKLETGYFMNKAKAKLPLDERKASILEMFSSNQHHSVTFILLTSMLVRITQELAGTMQEVPSSPSKTNSDLPASPRVPVKRKSLNHDPTIARRQLVQQNLAAVFADVLIRLPEATKAKNKNAQQERRRELVMIFIETESG